MNSWFSYGTQAKHITPADNIDRKLSHITPAVASSWLIEMKAMNQV